MAREFPFVLTAILLASTPFAILAAADSGQQSTQPEQPPPASQNPELAPPAPPSKIDPGILKQPDNLPPPDPEAVVPPPVVDPKMAIDPETTPRTGDTPPPPPPNQPGPSR
jgi:hypothetical protein